MKQINGKQDTKMAAKNTPEEFVLRIKSKVGHELKRKTSRELDGDIIFMYGKTAK